MDVANIHDQQLPHLSQVFLLVLEELICNASIDAANSAAAVPSQSPPSPSPLARGVASTSIYSSLDEACAWGAHVSTAVGTGCGLPSDILLARRGCVGALHSERPLYTKGGTARGVTLSLQEDDPGGGERLEVHTLALRFYTGPPLDGHRAREAHQL